jgi:predicted small secreted protein
MKTSTGLVVALVICILISLCALGCNTFKGAGKDIEKGGKSIQNAADNVEKGGQRPSSCTITASAEKSGTISPSGATSVPCRSSRTFTIKANRGYHVADVLVDGKSVGAVRRYTFDKVTENHTISAMFTMNPTR